MSKHEEFISVIKTLKALSPIVTNQQHKALLQQAKHEYGLSIDEATKILNLSGLTVGENVDYIDVLGLSLQELQNQSEKNIVICIETAHKELYNESLRSGGLPRADGRTQEQWRTMLNKARDTLKNSHKRREYIANLMFQKDLTYISSNDTHVKQNIKPTQTNSSQSISIPPTSISGTKKITPIPDKTGNMMLIPAGEFQIDRNENIEDTSEKTKVSISVEAFYIDKNLVTNAQYSEFVSANPQWSKPSKWYELKIKQKVALSQFYHDGDYLKHWNGNIYPKEKADHPVTWVSWYAAMAYAKWVGKRLPTEVEWEKAAQCTAIEHQYPWGDTLDATRANYNNFVGDTTPIGHYPPNAYGVYDMLGNVWEWCLDMYETTDNDILLKKNPVLDINSITSTDSKLKDNTIYRILRGGSWLDAPKLVSPTYRYKNIATRTLARIGFRCVKSIM